MGTCPRGGISGSKRIGAGVDPVVKLGVKVDRPDQTWNKNGLRRIAYWRR